MPQMWAIAMFLGVVFTMNAAVHVYLWVRLVRDPGWGLAVRRAATILLVGLALLVPAGLVGARTLPHGAASVVSGLAFVWMGAVFFLVVGLFFADAGRFALRRLRSGSSDPADPADPERRQALARLTAAGVGAAATAVTGVSMRSALGDIGIKEQAIRLPRLPTTLDGLSVVQLSDIHVGPTIGRRFLSGVVEKTNALAPDIIVVTGDLVDGSVARLSRHVEPLARLRARYGVYFVTGNHDFYSGADAWCAYLSKLGLQVMRNRAVRVGDAGGRIQLAGIDDHHHTAGRGIGAAMAKGLDPELETVLFAHQPQSIGDASAMKAGLQISGHTHGGQIYPMTELVKLTTPYVAGLYRHDENTQIYVSRGTGYWGPPMRLLAPAEISKLVLTT